MFRMLIGEQFHLQSLFENDPEAKDCLDAGVGSNATGTRQLPTNQTHTSSLYGYHCFSSVLWEENFHDLSELSNMSLSFTAKPFQCDCGERVFPC
ncbi:hypothetical protein TNIN_400071 [Trichonephila inaurata madagascariensis]|uniref:Uncharacterized protein n=1 Tax=Trichonephila inaurata madagascariensis TaxID=2747483 RepID=A0A8X7CHJ5_9ARAC|nr:hypothetical protein TNIN_400071 [Trichonephila inaurata madagascariensis]